jgi:hypothetical protein
VPISCNDELGIRVCGSSFAADFGYIDIQSGWKHEIRRFIQDLIQGSSKVDRDGEKYVLYLGGK